MSELGKTAEDIINRRRDDEVRRQYLKDREEIRILERQKFIHDMIDRKLSMQESLELGRELGIDITAAFYCVVLMQVFPKNPKSAEADEYSGVSEEIYRRIKELYADVSHVFLYEQVGDVLCFLEKADTTSEMEKNITNGIANLESLMKSYTDNIYFISVGKPVERMRDVNLSYDDASRKFAERYMCGDSFVFFGDDMPRSEMLRDTAEKFRRESGKQKTDEKIDLGSLNIGQMSQKTIFHFLRNGTLSEVEDFTEDYFGSIGKDALESLMLRRYVLIEAFFACAALLESLGMEKEKMGEAFGEYCDPVRFSENYEESRKYIIILLTHTIGYRNSMADKRYNEIIDRAKKYIQENYQNEDMSLQSVASKVNVSSNHFSTIFRKETGENFIDYLTAVRMDKAKELLCLTGMKSSDVGFEVGYRDPHYFSY
ncbi:MAG: helix-turn-helix domain-containing protein, partial [Lachnospiraceae bacterium]|nr:helix-turn-helix domain-containing protein [Lachnospiraceae bacterium]